MPVPSPSRAPRTAVREEKQPHPPGSPTHHHHHHSGELRKYVCDHNSAPPAHQYITTDKTNILIRALTLKRSKDELAGRAQSAFAAGGHQRAAGPSSSRRAGAPGVGSAGAASGSAAAAAASRPKGLAAGAGGAANDAKGKRVASSSQEGGGELGGAGAERPTASGLERAAKRPALDSPSTAAAFSQLEGLTVEQLRHFLRSKGQTAGVDHAGRAALLARAKLALSSSSAGRR